MLRIALGSGICFALAACGGTDNGRPSSEPAGQLEPLDPCRAADGLELQNVLNFETTVQSGSQPLAVCDAVVESGRATTPRGCTYFNYDVVDTPSGVAGANIYSRPDNSPCLQLDGTPLPDSVALSTNTSPNPISPSAIDGSGTRCGQSSHAFHLSASNMSICLNPSTGRQGWGATLQISFNTNTDDSGRSDAPVDLSAWDGISFWVRKGDDVSTSHTAVLASVQDPYTSAKPTALTADGNCPRPPGLADNQPTPDCWCLAIDGVPDAEKCDAFGVAVGLTNQWHFIKAPFATLQQKGFGQPSWKGHLDSSMLTGLQFSLSAGDWDLWLDDIAVYRTPQ